MKFILNKDKNKGVMHMLGAVAFCMLILSGTSCRSGSGLAANRCQPLEKAYAELLKERDSLLIENKQLKRDNHLLGRTLTEQMVEQDITADE